MPTFEPSGYFESIVGNQVFGWACDADGNPAPVTVQVSGAAVEAKPAQVVPRKRGDTIEDRCRFELQLDLKNGDRVEIFHGTTKQTLRGGVRWAFDPAWRPRVGIICPVRQEARYLLEWIAHHRALGIDFFLLGDNGGDDGTSELLIALDQLGIIQRVDWLGEVDFQLRFDMDAVARVRDQVDLCAINDVDEFIRPLNGRPDIPTALAEIFSRQEVSAVALSCAVYGSSGHAQAGDGLVLERFTRRAPQQHKYNKQVKVVVRPSRLDAMRSAHVAILNGGDYIDDRGDPWVPRKITWENLVGHPVTWNSLRIDHHVIKSREEFDEKARRGVVLASLPPRDDVFFDVRDINDEEDPMPAEFVARMKRELALLAQLLAGKSKTSAIPPLWTGFTPMAALSTA